MNGSEVLVFALVFLSVLLLAAGGYGMSRRGGAGQRQRRARRLAGVSRARARQETAGFSIRRQTRKSRLPGLDRMLGRLLPRTEVLQGRLGSAGLKATATEYLIGLTVMATLLAALAKAMLHLPLVLALSGGIVLGAGLPHFLLLRIEARRRRRLLDQLPDALDSIVRAVKAGLPVTQAMFTIGEEMPPPLGRAFQTISNQVRLGQGLAEALEETAERLQVSEFNFLAISLALQQETGGNLTETLENLSATIRQRHQLRLKVKALSSEARASAYIVGALPFVVFAGMLALNPGYMMVLFTHPVGPILLGAALLSLATGAFLMWRMVNFEV
jgi:tight adherence protein B